MCELCETIEANEDYIIRGSWADLSFEKSETSLTCRGLNYIKSHYKIFAYGEGEAEMEIFYCPLCGRKLGD